MELHWVDDRLAVMTRPDGTAHLADDMTQARDAGLEIIVSCLQPDEEREIGLSEEQAEARNAGLGFLRFAMQDGGTPDDDVAFDDFIEELAAQYRDGRAIATHCRHGLGRSPLVTAAVLVRLGASADEAWGRITAARGHKVPDNDEQRDYISRYEARLRGASA